MLAATEMDAPAWLNWEAGFQTCLLVTVSARQRREQVPTFIISSRELFVITKSTKAQKMFEIPSDIRGFLPALLKADATLRGEESTSWACC